ncbi:hypothetical protein NDU88_003566 [Pleurodeles waltl]|uniref:Uncharacterized protein n=1 Tax=Pleurodeles waltl TaxID=8319 RepID=A0AAV7M6M8_PLEWA|nr:hypothetical protein NDU88_003566 [Pleurodeles waltl]
MLRRGSVLETLPCNIQGTRQPAGRPLGKPRLGVRVVAHAAAHFSGRRFQGRRGRVRDIELGLQPCCA